MYGNGCELLTRRMCPVVDYVDKFGWEFQSCGNLGLLDRPCMEPPRLGMSAFDVPSRPEASDGHHWTYLMKKCGQLAVENGGRRDMIPNVDGKGPVSSG
jgi:hypothetical protein